MTIQVEKRMYSRSFCTVAAAVLALSSGACDFAVTNPGPTQDGRLSDPGSHESVVNGARFMTARALGDLAYIGSEPAREVTTAGRVFPVKLPVVSGQLRSNDVNRQWNLTHQARFTAEDAVRRFEEVISDAGSHVFTAQALKIAGFANRILGENMCYAVIDGGGAEPHAVHFGRAEQAFTRAIEIAGRAGRSELQTAAYAGRAQVRLHLGDLTGASADAARVPTSFVHAARYTDQINDQRNIVYWTNDNVPYRAHSVWNTQFESYYLESGDPRARWGRNPDVPNGEFANVPWYFQLKYEDYEASIRLASGREMRLIEAEIALLNGTWEAAIDYMNAIRATVISDETGAPLPALTAASATEAWTHLKRERGVELWLEARRLGDLRRWIDAGTPGWQEDMSGRSVCFPIADSERQTNPNIPLD
jgi:starch-binding outer membrane protein, SusD/RagB family